MYKYVIERKIPKIGDASRKELREAARKSREALEQLGTGIQWVHSYVTEDMTYCIYLAESEDLIYKHSEISGFPADKVSRVRGILDLTAARVS